MSVEESAEQDEDASKLDEAEEVLSLVFVAGSDSPEGLELSNGSLHLPAAFETSQWTSILGHTLPILAVGRDHFDADLAEIGIKTVTVICLIPNQTLRKIEAKRSIERVLHKLDFSRTGTGSVDREWRATRVHHNHALGAFAFLGWPDI